MFLSIVKFLLLQIKHTLLQNYVHYSQQIIF